MGNPEKAIRFAWGVQAVKGLVLGVVASAWLVACLGLVRLFQLYFYWPSADTGLWRELHQALWMGLRFDLKVCATAALLLWPLLSWRRLARPALIVWSVLFLLLAVINFYYYGFYKAPIDGVVFGVLDDDTAAIFKTIWLDFPLLQILLFVVLALGTGVAGTLAVQRRLDAAWQRWAPSAVWVLSIPVLVLMQLLLAKGTIHGMALQRANLTVTTQPFLNAAVPNGVTALHNAWYSYQQSFHVRDMDGGLKALGFASVQEAAQALGLPAQSHDEIAGRLRASGQDRLSRRHLVFFQMESWSAEPLRYQSPQFDVMGRLQAAWPQATVFDNFDSAHVGTHPSLEAILLGTPLTPISTGRHRDVVFDWGIAHVFRRAGYDTLFVTSGESGWRELDRVLPRQGFNEFVDAARLRQMYPQAKGGTWGVWDAYLTRYIKERLLAQPAGRPLFVYAMTTTHHPPYEIPDEARRSGLDMRLWKGARVSESLEPSLYSYRYANEVLADFVDDVARSPLRQTTLIAATGDHNMRTLGDYAEPERQAMRHQVPFAVWGAPALRCPERRHEPASHLDMFPTLMPMLGIHSGYLLTGRDLWRCDDPSPPLALGFVSQVRSPAALWQVGQKGTSVCGAPARDCPWPEKLDLLARARLALLDWNVRREVLRTAAKVTP